MRPKEKNYKFELKEEDVSNELLIQKIRNAISTLPLGYFSFVIVELFKSNSKAGIPFFQTTRHRTINKTQYYSAEINVSSEHNGQIRWKIYEKSMQTKEQVLQIFDEICVKRINPDLSDWKENGKEWHEPGLKETNAKLLKHMPYDYWANETPTEIDDIIYLEALRYYINNYDMRTAEKGLALADEYRQNGQYQEAKDIYEQITFEDGATYELANMIMSGKLGKPDYKLAYEYYHHTCLIDELNYYGAKIKIAQMHRDGKYFKPNYRIYKNIIKSIEKEYEKDSAVAPALCELYYELALIEQAEGNKEQALSYCLEARKWAKEYLTYGNCLGHIFIAIKIFNLLYTLTDFDVASADAFDLFYLLNAPLKVVFLYENKKYVIDCFYDKHYLIIKFGEKYFRGSVNFFSKATIGGHKFLHQAKKITIVEVQK